MSVIEQSVVRAIARAVVELFGMARQPAGVVACATFFFGFGAGALLNLYLAAVSSPLVTELRASLSYKSSIIGDGLLLPVINGVAFSALRAHRGQVDARTLAAASVLAAAITVYFHVAQAKRRLVNWAMPSPWHWNVLGAWHALYMYCVCTLLSLFYVVVGRAAFGFSALPLSEVGGVTCGLAAFFVLLRLDYVDVSLTSVIPTRIFTNSD